MRNHYTHVYELLPMLNNLVLTGVDDGELEFLGNDKEWAQADYEEGYYCNHRKWPEEVDDYDRYEKN